MEALVEGEASAAVEGVEVAAFRVAAAALVAAAPRGAGDESAQNLTTSGIA